MMNPARTQRGVTLVELLVVLMILSLILTAAVKTWDVTLERGRYEQTRRKLDQFATVITGDPNYVVEGRRADFGYVGDNGVLPTSLADLVTEPPVTPPESSRWRGPYIRAAINESPDSYRRDAWGDTIVFNPDSMFVRSRGGGGLANPAKWITRTLGFRRDAVLYNRVAGRVVDARGTVPNADARSRLLVQLQFPRFGLPYVASDSVRGNGEFLFSDVPQGTHLLRVTYWTFDPPPAHADTALKDVVVVPGAGAQDVTVRMPVYWSSP